ncbi:PEGA domain-containing protein [Opitutaceae bacterium TAV4]|nr:PEGA domain-containing protein [Opitutaceae bacterium TAV4]RRK00550.1 PEGA domain-containing protein [Opitutaceae bacterium TAV3]
MNIRPILTASLLTIALAATGCAIFTKGRTQVVTVQSIPAGATALINGETVGQTPFKVRLPRSSVYRIDLKKEGFLDQNALLLPMPNEYEQNYLRWGIDYDLGAMTDLVPENLVVNLRPDAKAAKVDLYTQMAAQVTTADAMLAANQISSADHKKAIEAILKTYAK